MKWIRTARDAYGLSRAQGIIHRGGLSSGEYAISLAHQLGYSRVLLLGYDCQRTRGESHHHGDHPPGLSNEHRYDRWKIGFWHLAQQTEIEIINCSRETTLSFPRMTIQEALRVRDTG